MYRGGGGGGGGGGGRGGWDVWLPFFPLHVFLGRKHTMHMYFCVYVTSLHTSICENTYSHSILSLWSIISLILAGVLRH